MISPVIRTIAVVSLIAAGGVLTACSATTPTVDATDKTEAAEVTTSEETASPDASADDAIATYFSYESMRGAEFVNALAATMADVDSYTCQVATTYRGPATSDRSSNISVTGLTGDSADVTVSTKEKIDDPHPDDSPQRLVLDIAVVTSDSRTYYSEDGGDTFADVTEEGLDNYRSGVFTLTGSAAAEGTWERQSSSDGTATYSSNDAPWAALYAPEITLTGDGATVSDVETTVTVDQQGRIVQLDYTAVMTGNTSGGVGDVATSMSCGDFDDVAPASAPENIG